MCDEDTEDDIDRAIARGRLTRRDFNALAAGTAAAMLVPGAARARGVVDGAVRIETPDGLCDAHLAHPASGRHPGVIVWPDIVGLRPAFEAMGRRLAAAGYAVLTINPYYRSVAAPVVPPGSSFRDPETREVLLPLARSLSATTTATDARTFADWLAGGPAVDPDRGFGTTGYCMGGAMAFRAAATVPARIDAVGSFHGSRLVTDADDSPHRAIPETDAAYLVAIAENDDERAPEDKRVLREAFAAAGLAAEIEVYEGAMHGWCPPDSTVHDPVQADRAFERLRVLFERALG
jgi:carboxymethylenebutenolidase